MNGFLISMGFVYGIAGFVAFNVWLFRLITGGQHDARRETR